MRFGGLGGIPDSERERSRQGSISLVYDVSQIAARVEMVENGSARAAVTKNEYKSRNWENRTGVLFAEIA
jgi:hypothetical protein